MCDRIYKSSARNDSTMHKGYSHGPEDFIVRESILRPHHKGKVSNPPIGVKEKQRIREKKNKTPLPLFS